MTKLFITGATGYIGGDALYTIAAAHPSIEITALARNSSKGAKIAAQYPKVKLVYGDLDASDLLTEEASKADIVVHCANADHVGGANAIVAGLAKRQSPSYLIHTSGTGILTSPDLQNKRLGESSDKIYDDWDGIKELTSFPTDYLHRNVDEIILAAHQKSSNINTAIVCPPTIYGPGRGPDNQRSIQTPLLVKATLQRGKGFTVGKGLNRWTQVHVQDLSEAFSALVSAAQEKLENGGDPASRSQATWNEEGYYFTESGSFVWGDISRAVAGIAHKQGLISSQDVDPLSADEAEKLQQGASRQLGGNSRGTAIRARKLLGWQPTQKSLEDSLEELVKSEARLLGLIKGHAEKVEEDA